MRFVKLCTFFAVVLLQPAAVSAQTAAPTFTRDIAPILQAKCEECHRPNQMAPMALVTFEDVRPWVKSIASRVGTRQMPPWHIDRTVGIQQFKNDRSLTDEQVDTVLRWAAAGAPRGDAKDLPPPRKWNDESNVWTEQAKLGSPDLVITSTPYTMPAVAQDAWWKP